MNYSLSYGSLNEAEQGPVSIITLWCMKKKKTHFVEIGMGILSASSVISAMAASELRWQSREL